MATCSPVQAQWCFGAFWKRYPFGLLLHPEDATYHWTSTRMHGVTSQKIAVFRGVRTLTFDNFGLLQSMMWSLHEFWWTVVAQSTQRTWQWAIDTSSARTHTNDASKTESLTFAIKCRFVGERLWAPVTGVGRPIARRHPLVGDLLHLVLATEAENVLSAILQ
jgi:hypothetical protein